MRIGVDHREIERQRYEHVKQVEQERQGRLNLSIREFLASFILNVWTAGWDDDSIYSDLSSTNDGNAECRWRLHTEMTIHFLSYDQKQNVGKGEAKSSFEYLDYLSGVDENSLIIDRHLRTCHALVLTHTLTRSWTESYSVLFSINTEWDINAQFIQQDCESKCS